MAKTNSGNGAVMVAGYLTAGSILLTSLLGMNSPEPEPAQIVTVAEDAVTSVAPPPTKQATPEPEYHKCPPTARACVDISAKKSWLQKDGVVDYGPVSINTGQPGWETPPGEFHVMRHVKDEVSYEFGLEPMPWSTYFSPKGIAFHEGDLAEMSHGCVHLSPQDAEHYFNTLKVLDNVVIFT